MTRSFTHASFLHIPAVARPRLADSFIEAPNAVRPLVGIGVEHALGHVHEEVFVAEADDTLDFPLIQEGVDPPDHLLVLARHRLASIAVKLDRRRPVLAQLDHERQPGVRQGVGGGLAIEGEHDSLARVAAISRLMSPFE